MRATPHTPYYKLRDRMNDIKMTQGELAGRLKRSAPYVHSRFIKSGKSFNLHECYEILKQIGVADSKLHDYFPRNGVTV